MKTIIKFLMAPVAAYFGLNWAVDNPHKTKHLTNQVNQRVEQGYEFALFQFKSFSSEPVAEKQQPSAKKRKKKEANNTQ